MPRLLAAAGDDEWLQRFFHGPLLSSLQLASL